MNLIIKENYDEATRLAAELIINEVELKNDAVIGLSGGATMKGVLESIVKDQKEMARDYSNVTTLNVDEYVGLLKEDEYRSFLYFMRENLFDHIQFKTNYIPKFNTNHPEERAKKYQVVYDENIPDLLVIGLGTNGHIGFNEPGTSFDSGTRLIKLDESTRVANSKYFRSLETVPHYAITIGLADIMKAKKIVLIATGLAKAEIIKKINESEITEDLPATILKKHNDVTLILDKEAASLL